MPTCETNGLSRKMPEKQLPPLELFDSVRSPKELSCPTVPFSGTYNQRFSEMWPGKTLLGKKRSLLFTLNLKERL